MKTRYVHEIWNPDEPIKVGQLMAKLERIREKYGANALIELDAGYNNIELMTTPSKKVRK